MLALLHEAAHSVHQPVRLAPLYERFRATAEGQRIAQLYERSPLPALQIQMDLASYLGELVIHSFVPDGALGPVCGLPADEEHRRSVRERCRQVIYAPDTGWSEGEIYEAWVLGAAADLVPLATRYLEAEQQSDESFVEHAFGCFAALFEQWDRAQRQREG
ncbi:MAG: hypothetical protein HY332_09230 [Chloroflexi bacterium]|nr:hypothetical protein [Chloroflexota bacterium]